MRALTRRSYFQGIDRKPVPRLALSWASISRNTHFGCHPLFGGQARSSQGCARSRTGCNLLRYRSAPQFDVAIFGDGRANCQLSEEAATLLCLAVVFKQRRNVVGI